MCLVFKLFEVVMTDIIYFYFFSTLPKILFDAKNDVIKILPTNF